MKHENIDKVIDYLNKLRDFGDHEGLGDYSDRMFVFNQAEGWTPNLWHTDLEKPIGISVDGIIEMLMLFEGLEITEHDHLSPTREYFGVESAQASDIYIPHLPLRWYKAEHALTMLEGLKSTGEVIWPDVEKPDDDEDFEYGVEDFGEDYDEDDEEDF